MLQRLFHDYFKPEVLEKYAMKMNGFSDCGVFMFASIRNCADIVFEMTFTDAAEE